MISGEEMMITGDIVKVEKSKKHMKSHPKKKTKTKKFTKKNKT